MEVFGYQHLLFLFSCQKSWAAQQVLTFSGFSENIVATLTVLHVRKMLDAIVDEKDLSNKPDPQIFLEAAKQLEISLQGCLAIEDAIAGVRTASMICLALTTTITRAILRMLTWSVQI